MLLRLQQAQRAGDQHAVDVRVDLGEIGRLEGHGDAEFGQRVGQLRPALVQQPHRVRPLGLQPPLHAVRGAKVAQLLLVGVGQRLKMPKHQRGDFVAGGQLDLRAGFARLQAFDQRAQRHQKRADLGLQHVAGAHVGHVAAFALVKADQHLTALDDVAHRQARAVAVAPRGALDGAQHQLGLDLAQVPQVVFQHALLDGDLRAGFKVLHLAAAARALVQPEMRAARLHAQTGFAVQRGQRGRFPLVLALGDLGADPFAGQRAVDEDHLAVRAAGDALGVQVDRVDAQRVFGQACGPGVGGGLGRCAGIGLGRVGVVSRAGRWRFVVGCFIGQIGLWHSVCLRRQLSNS